MLFSTVISVLRFVCSLFIHMCIVMCSFALYCIICIVLCILFHVYFHVLCCFYVLCVLSWGWVWAETTEDERVRVSPNSTKQRANMIFYCLIFLLSDVFHWWKYIPSLVVSWFTIIIIVINCTGFIYTILLRKDPLKGTLHRRDILTYMK